MKQNPSSFGSEAPLLIFRNIFGFTIGSCAISGYGRMDNSDLRILKTKYKKTITNLDFKWGRELNPHPPAMREISCGGSTCDCSERFIPDKKKKLIGTRTTND